ncbi:hypothetical protein QOZ01_07315 [Corynebacterium diphtheriae]
MTFGLWLLDNVGMAIPITLRKKIADFDPIREGITVQQFCKNIGVSKQTYYSIKAALPVLEGGF